MGIHTLPLLPLRLLTSQLRNNSFTYQHTLKLTAIMSSGGNTVNVKGISHETTEKEVRDFFSFCGKISDLTLTPKSQDETSKSYAVSFEKPTAAKTALLLDNTQLGSNHVNVTAASDLDAIAPGKTAGHSEGDSPEDIAQEDKPRSRIFAEYLAHGYVLTDNAIEKAIDQQYGLSQKANQGWRGLSSYFEKAAETPTGQKMRAFYEQGSKQVLDVHNEAKHLAGLKTGKGDDLGLHNVAGTNRTACNCGAKGNICQCAAGKCDCSSCPKNSDVKSTDRTAEEAEMEFVEVDGQKKTKCNCGGTDEKCPCEPGKCACSGCSKAS